MLKERVDLYWDMYKFELNTRDSLNTQISLPIAITTINFGALTYCVGKLTSVALVLSFVTLILAIISTSILLISIVCSVIFIIKGYHNNYVYSIVSSPKVIEEIHSDICRYYSELNEFNDTIDQDNSEKIDEDFKLQLINVYGLCNEKNVLNNDTRSAFIFNAKTAIIVGLIASAISFSFCNFKIISNIIVLIK